MVSNPHAITDCVRKRLAPAVQASGTEALLWHPPQGRIRDETC